MTKRTTSALATIIGYVIGVGMFGLPYLTMKSGLLVFFVLLLFLGFVQYMLHLIYANVILETEGSHRMAGYAEIYVGRAGKYLTLAANVLGGIGAMLAYIIVTGKFLAPLLVPYFGGSEFIYANISFWLMATVIYFGVWAICKAEMLMTGILFLIVAAISFKGLGNIDAANFSLVQWKYFFLPFGALLFALDGLGSVPIIANVLGNNPANLKKAIKYGLLIPALVFLVFTLVVLGVSGDMTTVDALTGLAKAIGDGIVAISMVFGLLVVATSFFVVGESIKEELIYDLKVKEKLAFALSMFIPYILYLLGFNNLIQVISFAGSLAGGISAIMLLLMFRKMEKMNKPLALFKHKPSSLLLGVLTSIFIFGIIYEIWIFSVNHP